MPQRNPLVMVGGLLRELPVGDSISGLAGGQGNTGRKLDFTDGTLSLVSGAAGESVSMTTMQGRPAIACTLSTVAGSVFIADFTLNTPVMIGGFQTLQIPVYFDSMAAADINGALVQVWLHTSTTSVRPQLSLEGQMPGAVAVYSVSRDSLLGGAGVMADLSADYFTKFRIVITAGSSSTTKPVIKIGEPVFDQRLRKGRVLLYLDGNYDSQAKMILPLLDRYGLKASMPLTTYFVGQAGRMTEAQLGNAYGNGHTLMHHTYGNKAQGWDNATAYPDAAAIVADIQAQWAWLQARGWTRGIGHTVDGYTSTYLAAVALARQQLVRDALASAGVKTGRTAGNYLSAAAGGVGHLFPAYDPRTNWLRLYGGLMVTSTHTAADVKAVIDAAELRGEQAHIVLHRFVPDASTPGALEMKYSVGADWIDYLAQRVRAGALECLTVDEAYARSLSGADQAGIAATYVSGLPSQAGNAGRVLTTDGTDAGWGMKITVSPTPPVGASLNDIWIQS